MTTGERDDPRGALVRPFSLTRGRTRARTDIAIEAILVTTARGTQEAPYAGHHKRLIATLCQQPQSLAEIAAHMRVPLGVANVLVADMADEDMLTLHTPPGAEDHDQRIELLERVLDGLRKL